MLEAVPAAVARAATRALAVPTIGIGAGGDADGQVLVWHDMLGYYEGHAPRFVKRYAELGDTIVEALGRYADEVRSGAFPEAQPHLRHARGGARGVRSGRARVADRSAQRCSRRTARSGGSEDVATRRA